MKAEAAVAEARVRTDESDRLAEQARRMRLALEQHMLKVQRLNSESGMMVRPAPEQRVGADVGCGGRCHGSRKRAGAGWRVLEDNRTPQSDAKHGLELSSRTSSGTSSSRINTQLQHACGGLV